MGAAGEPGAPACRRGGAQAPGPAPPVRQARSFPLPPARPAGPPPGAPWRAPRPPSAASRAPRARPRPGGGNRGRGAPCASPRLNFPRAAAHTRPGADASASHPRSPGLARAFPCRARPAPGEAAAAGRARCSQGRECPKACGRPSPPPPGLELSWPLESSPNPGLPVVPRVSPPRRPRGGTPGSAAQPLGAARGKLRARGLGLAGPRG